MCWPIACSRTVSRPPASFKYLSISSLALAFLTPLAPLAPLPSLLFLRVMAWLRSTDLVIVVDADGVVGAGQRHLRHGRGFHRQGGKVLGLEAVHRRLAAGARQHLRFQRQRVQE